MRVYLSEKADRRLTEYMASAGAQVTLIHDEPLLGAGTGSHADLHMCRVGDSIVFGEKADFSAEYPGNAAFCAVCLDRYLIHRLDATSPKVLHAAKDLIPVNVRQGYTRCSCAVVDGSSVITQDDGIFRALSSKKDISVLKVAEGHVLLPGYNTGFIGGTCGRVGDELIFNGNLEDHPDFERIRSFVAARGVKLRYFTEYPLTDIGSIIAL